MIRRLLLVSLALTLALRAADLWSQSQQSARVWTVGNLLVAADRDDPMVVGLLDGLGQLGYVEGRNLRFEFRTARGDPEKLLTLAEELVQLKPDVIVVMAPHAARAVQRASGSVPIVGATFDPVRMGMANSLSHPGGQLTGLSSATVELYAKRLQLLQEMIPRLKRVAVLRNPAAPTTSFQTTVVEDLKAAAASMSITLEFVNARAPSEFQTAFAAIGRTQPQALLLVEHPLFYVHRSTLAKLAMAANLPALYGTTAFCDEGGLMCYGADYTDQARRMAGYVDKILKGAHPANLPIEEPTKFELAVNLKTAKALGVTVPESILVRADEVIR